MGSLGVVDFHPIGNHFKHLADPIKQVSIQQLRSKGPVKALHISVLGWFSWLDVVQGNSIVFAPINQCCGNQFRTVIDADLFGKGLRLPLRNTLAGAPWQVSVPSGSTPSTPACDSMGAL